MKQAQKVVQTMFSSTTIPNLLCVDQFVLHDKVAGGNFGLLDEQYQPHPQATAYFTTARLLSGAMSGTIESRGMLTVYCVERNGRPPVTAIANAGTPTLVTFKVNGPTAPIVWDMLGRPTKPDVQGGTFSMNVAYAIMVEGDVTPQAAVVPALSVALAADGTPEVRVSVGGAPELAGARVRLAVPDLEIDQTLPLAAAGDVAFALDPTKVEPGRQYKADLGITLPSGAELQQAATIELTPIYRVTDAEAKSLAAPQHLPAITLTGEDAFRPFNKKRTYGGPTDNSAAIRIGWTSKELVLWVEQQDDTHWPIPPGVPNPFGYDSFQWAFQPEGELAPGARSLEITGGILKTGKPMARVLGQPHYNPTAEAQREGTTTRYRVTMPIAQLGIEPDAGRSIGMAVNLNDNDGDGRKGWMFWGQGINGQKNPAMYRRVILTKGHPTDIAPRKK